MIGARAAAIRCASCCPSRPRRSASSCSTLYGAEIVALARRARLERRRRSWRASSPPRTRRSTCRSSTRTRRTPRRTTAAPPRDPARAARSVDAFVAGLGTGGTLMGSPARLREANPDVQIVAAEPLQGDPVSGLRSLDDGYMPEVLDVTQLDRKLLVTNGEAVRGLRPAGPRGGRSSPASPPARRARRLPRRRRARRARVVVMRACRTAAGSTCPPGSGARPRRARGRHGVTALVVDGRRCRGRSPTSSSRMRARAAERGLRHPRRPRRRAVRFHPARNADASPYRYTIEPRDQLQSSRDRGRRRRRARDLPLAHALGRRIPSRTDVDLAFWPDAAYLIVSLEAGTPDLKAFAIRDGGIARRDLVIA